MALLSSTITNRNALARSPSPVTAFSLSIPKKTLYTLTWFDCMGSPPEVFKGRFEGDVLNLAHGGPGMHVRLTYDLREAGQPNDQHGNVAGRQRVESIL